MFLLYFWGGTMKTNTSPDKYLGSITENEDNTFGDWYRKNDDVRPGDYYILLQVHRFLIESNSNIEKLNKLIEYHKHE